MAAYAEACAAELRRAARRREPAPGHQRVRGRRYAVAPTPELLRTILEAVALAPAAEVTAECNPEDASAERFARWQGAGVTRVSFGVQSMVPHVLQSLGRRHGTTQVARAVALAGEAGFESVNVDLILGAAGETDADAAATLEAVLALEPRPPHVSAYALTVEPGTALAARPGPSPRRRCRRPALRAGGRGVVGGGLPVVRGVELGGAQP